MMALKITGNGLFKGVLGFFAAIIKYHAIVVSGVYWGLRFLRTIFKRKSVDWLDTNLLAGAVSICGLTIFFLIYYKVFGIWILPDKFKLTLPFSYLNIANNFFSYGFYLASMFFLTIPFLEGIHRSTAGRS